MLIITTLLLLSTGIQNSQLSQGDQFKQAISAATQAIRANPKHPDGWLQRADIYRTKGEHAKAAADYAVVTKLQPDNANVWQRQGEEHFKCGKFVESVTDFDRFLSLVPSQKPFHWQRGISLYYAGKFADGKKQFEIHQTVNSNDVENAVWHFLCTTRAEGISAAKKGLIPIEGDARVPMSQVHQLFAGTATPDDVLAAARNAPSQNAGEPMFYANLYLGIYYEATGDPKKARQFIFKAAERAKENGYMGDVARVHADVLRKGKAAK